MSKAKFFSIILSITLICFRVANAKWNSTKFDKKMYALAKALEFIEKRPMQMNQDATFGVTLAEANLRMAIQHKNVMLLDKHEKDYLERLLILCQRTRKLLQINYSRSEFSRAMTPQVWMRPIVWRKIIMENTLKARSNLTVTYIQNIMYNGHPQPAESDECLTNLLVDCKFSDFCRDIMTNINDGGGYPLTHKLLMKQMIIAFKCNVSTSRFLPYISFNLCTSILQELINIESLGFPRVSRDLALEQMVLCGMEGFLDFLTNHYEQLLLDWQHIRGCYPIFTNFSRRKRAANFIDFGCVNHTTGVAVALLALFIRKDVETMKDL